MAQLRPSLIADWQAAYPEDTEERLIQLAERTTLYERGELYVRDGIAQFENVVVRPQWRGRGLGRRLVVEALHRSAQAGADIWFLIAEATDWPLGWYERLGYRAGSVVHVYQRTPSK
ncbi:GNAT family N-acetyltransferase [Actinokineospora diospyrosa]|uniref:Acetyltransferase (GNAT) domain-containing protein n=1 Tax=Actinokineospora diospyrosa TaxID=103728 RepID=A0ABT1ILD7_9PSEU|nr:GNAT family N-acetyltransferase [Actinokineospora diospyrosa]MCP2273473.1 Acetyltransferase (GNAT) domain-containing protein [Actinokineospora diospyrosa]